MKVKGTGIKTTKDFVKSRFPKSYEKWLQSLNENSRKLYEGITDVSQWYPIEEAYIMPVRKIAELFYEGKAEKCGEDIGQFSADIALKGVYKVFLLIASPNFLMKRASKIISTFYVPSEVNIANSGAKNVTLEVINFDKIDLALEYRIAGWCKRALELANCNQVNYEVTSFISKGHDKTVIHFNWN